MTTSLTPRAPKRKDYQRIALAAAQVSVRTQAAAHVRALQAADTVTAAASAVRDAELAHAQAVAAQTAAVAEVADLLGVDEAARRLDLTAGTVRSAQRSHRTQVTAVAVTTPASAAGDDGKVTD